MAEVQPRPPRGRGNSVRTGRGGRTSRGDTRRSTNGHHSVDAAPEPSLEEQGELGQLKKQYNPQISTLKELFPDWTDEDLVFACQETNGDLSTAIERISEGNISRFSDVKKKTREKSRAKPVDSTTADSEVKNASVRGRGRGGLDTARGTRGRGTERGRGGSVRGRATARMPSAAAPTPETTSWADDATATAAAVTAMSTADANHSAGWDSAPSKTDANADSWGTQSKDAFAESAATAPPPDPPKSNLIPQDSKKSWASMLAKPKNIPLVSKPVSAKPVAIESDLASTSNLASIPDSTQHMNQEVAEDIAQRVLSQPSQHLPPPQDPLTEDNLQNLPDISQPLASETVTSNKDVTSTANSVTTPSASYTASQQAPIGRPPMGGYATSAWKATGTPGRSASFQRRILEQQEAVVMPGNHAVDRATVQFGSMGLSGDGQGKPLDVDEDREEAETRAQPPQQSPSQPRASLPPNIAQLSLQSDSAAQDNYQQSSQYTQSHQQAASGGGLGGAQPLSGPSTVSQSGSHPQSYNQYGRYGAGSIGQEHSAPNQKQYDPFSQQLNYTNQTEQQSGYAAQNQTSSQHQGQSQGAYSQAQGDYGSQQATETNNRNSYQNYGYPYGQQGASGSTDENAAPQRSTSAFGAGADSGYGSQPAPSRYADTSASSHTAHSHMGSQQGHHMHQQQGGQSGYGGGYGYGSPYGHAGYNYNGYMNQYPSQYGYNQQGYAQPYGNSKGSYGQQPHAGYSMNPQSSYDQLSSSPSTAGPFGASSLHTQHQGRDSSASGFPSSMHELSRSGSTQPSASQQHGGFGSDNYGRSTSGYSAAQHGQHSYGTAGGVGSNGADDLKPFAETSKSGPSPSLGGGSQPGRPGSGLNNPGGAGNATGQSGFGGAQGQHQQGFSSAGGYPSHLNTHTGSQYGATAGLGGLGGQQGGQSHQGGQYGGGYGGFSNNSYGNFGRGAWSGSYGH